MEAKAVPVARPFCVTSEVGSLRTVLLHRPGDELRRLTPRNSDQLLFDGIPWVERAQLEHDMFADLLRGRGVEVLLLEQLLVQTLAESRPARSMGITAAVDARRVGHALAEELTVYLRQVTPEELAAVLIAGMTFDELPFGAAATSLVRRMHHGTDFVIEPLPNLLFTRDSSVWVGKKVAITSLAMPARARETSVTDLVYAFHPRFLGVRRAYESHIAPMEGGDVLLLAAGVVAIGVGDRTSPAGAEALARSLFEDNLAHTVLVVPITQHRATMHLDTVCTMVDRDAVVMYPAIQDSLATFTIRASDAGTVEIRGPDPFLPVAAEAMGIDRLRVVDTGRDGVTAEREQWDDGNNTLAVAPGVVVAYERNENTNLRLADAGVEVLTIPGSELVSGRGGPRCLSCPLLRDEV